MDVKKLESDRYSIKLYLLGETHVSVMIMTIFSVFFMVIFASCSKPSSDTEKPLVPFYGTGSHHVIIFTDYFCSPCQALESELDIILNKLMDKGDVKVTFVDAPVNRHTQQYAKYLLYSANAGANFKDILRIRHILFSIAKTNAFFTDEEIAAKLREQGIAFQPYDLNKVYVEMNEMMKNYDIRSTPTCVVKYSRSDIRKYKGPEEIKQGLTLLFSPQRPVK